MGLKVTAFVVSLLFTFNTLVWANPDVFLQPAIYTWAATDRDRIETGLAMYIRALGYPVSDINFHLYPTIKGKKVDLFFNLKHKEGKGWLVPASVDGKSYEAYIDPGDLSISFDTPAQKALPDTAGSELSASDAFELLSSIGMFDADIEDLLSARRLIREIENYDIRDVLIVGNGLSSLPYFLALTGRRVTFIDMDASLRILVNDRILTINEALFDRGLAPMPPIKFVVSEFGELDIDENDIKKNSFDLITCLDLAGGRYPEGDPREWFEKARELLKPEAYVVMDVSKPWVKSLFEEAFPERKPLAGGMNFEGSYERYFSDNKLYRVKTLAIGTQVTTPDEPAIRKAGERAQRLVDIIENIVSTDFRAGINDLTRDVVGNIANGIFTAKVFLIALNMVTKDTPVIFAKFISAFKRMGIFELKDGGAAVPAATGRDLFPAIEHSEKFRQFETLLRDNPAISWGEGADKVAALVMYNPAGGELKIFPTKETLRSDPELAKLERKASTAFVPDEGLFGGIRIEELFSDGVQAVLIDEVQPSIGFRDIRPVSKRERYRDWNKAACEHLLSLARKAGYTEAYASTEEVIRERYNGEKKLNQGNLKENYRRPFRENWQKVDVVMGVNRVKLWHRELAQSEKQRTGRRAPGTEDGLLNEAANYFKANPYANTDDFLLTMDRDRLPRGEFYIFPATALSTNEQGHFNQAVQAEWNARRLAEDHLSDDSTPRIVFQNIGEAVYELATNCIKRGNGGVIMLSVKKTGDAVVFRVDARDFGPGLANVEEERKKSFSETKAGQRRGHGFRSITSEWSPFRKGTAIYGTQGNTWTFDPVKNRFEATGPSDVKEGLHVTLELSRKQLLSPDVPATISWLKRLIAPKMPFAEYAVKVAPWVEEGIFLGLPSVIGYWLLGFEAIGMITLMAVSRAVFFFAHEGARPHAPPAAYRIPLTVAVAGFAISLVPVFGGLLSVDYGLTFSFILSPLSLIAASTLVSVALHAYANITALRNGLVPAALDSSFFDGSYFSSMLQHMISNHIKVSGRLMKKAQALINMHALANQPELNDLTDEIHHYLVAASAVSPGLQSFAQTRALLYAELQKMKMQEFERTVKDMILGTRQLCERLVTDETYALDLARRLIRRGRDVRVVRHAAPEIAHWWVESDGYMIDAYPEGRGAEKFDLVRRAGDEIFVIALRNSYAANTLYQGEDDRVLTEKARRAAADHKRYYEQWLGDVSILLGQRILQLRMAGKENSEIEKDVIVVFLKNKIKIIRADLILTADEPGPGPMSGGIVPKDYHLYLDRPASFWAQLITDNMPDTGMRDSVLGFLRERAPEKLAEVERIIASAGNAKAEDAAAISRLSGYIRRAGGSSMTRKEVLSLIETGKYNSGRKVYLKVHRSRGSVDGYIRATDMSDPGGEKYLHINDIAVREDSRARGIASGLFNDIFELAKSEGYTRFSVWPNHAAVEKIALSHGFTKDGRIYSLSLKTLSPPSDPELIRRLAIETRKACRDLGACGTHALDLARRLIKEGRDARIFTDASQRHVWVEAGGYVVDAFPEGMGNAYTGAATEQDGEMFVITSRDSETATELYSGAEDVSRTAEAAENASNDVKFYRKWASLISGPLAKQILWLQMSGVPEDKLEKDPVVTVLRQKLNEARAALASVRKNTGTSGKLEFRFLSDIPEEERDNELTGVLSAGFARTDSSPMTAILMRDMYSCVPGFRPEHDVFIAFEDGHPVATYNLVLWKKFGEVYGNGLHVLPGKRGEGIGSLTRDALFKRLARDGYKTFISKKVEPTREAQQLQEKLVIERSGAARARIDDNGNITQVTVPLEKYFEKVPEQTAAQDDKAFRAAILKVREDLRPLFLVTSAACFQYSALLYARLSRRGFDCRVVRSNRELEKVFHFWVEARVGGREYILDAFPEGIRWQSSTDDGLLIFEKSSAPAVYANGEDVTGRQITRLESEKLAAQFPDKLPAVEVSAGLLPDELTEVPDNRKPSIKEFQTLLEMLKQDPVAYWDRKSSLGAKIRHEDISQEFEIYPTDDCLKTHPELALLDILASDDRVPSSGMFGVLRIRVLKHGDELALWFREVHPSIGYRKIRPKARRMGTYGGWSASSIDHIIRLAKKAGFTRFYASSPGEIKEKYLRELRTRISRGTLREFYRDPFALGWKKTAVTIDGLKTLLWTRDTEQQEEDPARNGPQGSTDLQMRGAATITGVLIGCTLGYPGLGLGIGRFPDIFLGIAKFFLDLADRIKKLREEGLAGNYWQITNKGYDILGIGTAPRIYKDLKELTGKGFLLRRPGVYSPLQDDGLGLAFARAVKEEARHAASAVKAAGRDNMRILVIGAGTGIDPKTAYYHASAIIPNVHVDAIDINVLAVRNMNYDLKLSGPPYLQHIRPQLVVQGKEFDTLEGRYDLILFQAPNAVHIPKGVHGYDPAILIDRDRFKNILGTAGEMLTETGAMLIRTKEGVFTRDPESLPRNLDRAFVDKYPYDSEGFPVSEFLRFTRAASPKVPPADTQTKEPAEAGAAGQDSKVKSMDTASLRDISDPQALAKCLAEEMLSACFGKKLVLAFDKDMAAMQTGNPKGLFEALKHLKEDPVYKKVLANMEIVIAPAGELGAKLKEYTADDSAEIFLFAREEARPALSALEVRAHSSYIDEKDLPFDSYYPIAEVVTIAFAQYFDGIIPAGSTLTNIRAGEREIPLSEMNIDSIASDNGVLIFKLLPKAEPCDKSELMKRYAELKRFLKSA